jgi:hypothetical protein
VPSAAAASQIEGRSTFCFCQIFEVLFKRSFLTNNGVWLPVATGGREESVGKGIAITINKLIINEM